MKKSKPSIDGTLGTRSVKIFFFNAKRCKKVSETDNCLKSAKFRFMFLKISLEHGKNSITLVLNQNAVKSNAVKKIP